MVHCHRNQYFEKKELWAGVHYRYVDYGVISWTHVRRHHLLWPGVIWFSKVDGQCDSVFFYYFFDCCPNIIFDFIY